MATTTLGRLGEALAESLAYLNSPARIDAEIARLEAAVAAGDASEGTRAQLADWKAVQAAQARLVGKGAGE